MSGWHSEGANGLPWERKRWERHEETDSLFVAWPRCSKTLASPPMRPCQPGAALSPALVPGPRPSHRAVSALGAVSTHKFMDQLSLLIWLQDETINRCQTHWQ